MWFPLLGLGRDPRETLSAVLSERYRALDCTLTASGTHALHLALLTAKALRGDLPVLLPAYTCYEVATAAVGADVRVALYDLDPRTLAPDWDSVRTAARQGTAAIVVAPLFGLPLDWHAARSIADELDAFLIADAAQAHGSSWDGRPVGCVGDLTVLSFGRGKGWTGGGGGALLRRQISESPTRPTGLARPGVRGECKTAISLAAQCVLGRPNLYGVPAALPSLGLGETIYHEPTFPAAMTRTSAAMLIANEKTSDREVSQRRNNSMRYMQMLSQRMPSDALIGAAFDGSSGALRFPLRVPGGWSALRKTDAPGLGAAPGYPAPLGDLPALRKLRTDVGRTRPGAEVLARELVTLPTHSLVSEREMRELARIVSGL